MQKDDERLVHSRGEEFLQVFKKGAEFTQELLRENERLRFRLLELEKSQMTGEVAPAAELKKLSERIADLEQEKQEILDRIKHVEEENQDFAARYLEIEDENNNLANLYIASYQLHSTLDFKEVLQIITEIIINLIGAEEFAIMLLDEKSDELQAVSTEGIDRSEIPSFRLGKGIIGNVAQSGENHFASDFDSYQRDFSAPMVCIPLKIKDHVIGVLAIYKLLMQKKEFAAVDYELFTLLAGHAATAIFSSRLYSDSERKLSTIQGFIDLLTK
ncbi:GAF domain-containing protein [Geomonas sp. Red69]|uniref:GAF domain-containing protein n=1 Tax=Geomonas diazotrophica TaxID=2843197 RepID=A0ABX8JNM2_9BACT|nr:MULTISPECIES: GAF domain-containing protein [Geomonas]MBU5635558.1 GAF domain-containing protein [Geomonas diazotrophica]QWV98199.1 GAF domain-containing protein [Geomonas nitrogeniifigens]